MELNADELVVRSDVCMRDLSRQLSSGAGVRANGTLSRHQRQRRAANGAPWRHYLLCGICIVPEHM